MAFPVVSASAAGSTTSDSTSHSVALPATVAANDLLIAFFSNDGTATVTWDNSTAGTWTLGHTTLRTTLARLTCYWKRADGTEGGKTLSVTTSAAEQAVFRVVAVAGAHTSTDPAFGTAANATSANPDPPAVTPSWGAEDTLWFAYFGNDDGRRSMSAIPTSYGNSFYDSSGGPSGCGLGTARRELNATTDDPGTFTISASQGWVSNTIAIRPAPAGIVATFNQSLGAATVSAAGALTAAATLSGTLGTASLASAGVAPIAAGLSATLGAATLSADASVTAAAALSQTLGAATLAATGAGSTESTADLSVALGAASLSADGSTPIAAALSASLAGASLSADAALPIAATLGASLDAATVSAASAVSVVADAGLTLGAATLSADGSLPATASAGITLGTASLSATGGAEDTSRQADAAITLGGASLSAGGVTLIVANAGASLSPASLGSLVSVLVSASSASTLGALTLSATSSDAVVAQIVSGAGRASARQRRPAGQEDLSRTSTQGTKRYGTPTYHRPG